jgi:hypothetical protein
LELENNADSGLCVKITFNNKWTRY